MELTQATSFKEKIHRLQFSNWMQWGKKSESPPFQNDYSYSLSCENATIIRKPNIRLNWRMHIAIGCLLNI